MNTVSVIMLSVAAAGMLACSGNEAKYAITGKNAPQDGAKVYLVDRLIADSIDSAVVADGTFQLKGKAAKDAFLGIVLEGSDWNYPLINDGVPMEINFADSTVSGSDLNVKLTECDKRNGREYARLNRLIDAGDDKRGIDVVRVLQREDRRWQRLRRMREPGQCEDLRGRGGDRG